MKFNIKSFLFHILVPLMLSFTITMLLPDYSEYLQSIKQPLVLPSIVFMIVWPILYILMGVSAYFIDNSNNKNSPKAMKYYYIQLFINLSYSFVFFYLHNIPIATIITLSLLVLSIVVFIKFIKINKIAGYLFIPYILWILIANYLQVGIYFLN